MKAFSYSSPRSLEGALALLATPGQDGRTMPIAGGQDLLTEMKEHLAEPDRLVNLKHVTGLDAIETGADRWKVGALVTLSQLESHADVTSRARVLAEAANSIASPQIRSTGTVGGNLNQRPRCFYYRLEGAKCLKKGGTECFSYGGNNKYNAILGGGPSYIVHPSDLAPALVALDAEVELVSAASGARRLSLESFYTLPSQGDVTRETVLRPDELLTHVSIPAPAAGTRSTYVKFKERGSYDFALASVALVVTVEGGVVRRARLVLGGVAPTPWRVPAAEAALVGSRLDDETARKVADLALRGAEPLEGNAYKVPLTKALVVRAVRALT